MSNFEPGFAEAGRNGMSEKNFLGAQRTHNLMCPPVADLKTLNIKH